MKNKKKINEKEKKSFPSKLEEKFSSSQKKKKFRLGPWAIQAQPRETKTNTPMI